jgi:hypothetical protein
MDLWKANWFTESGVLNADSVALSIKADQILAKQKSTFQELTVFKRQVLLGQINDYSALLLMISSSLIDSAR